MISRKEIKENIKEYIRKGKPWQPDILLVKKEDISMIIKDYSEKKFIYRFFVGRWSVWRETFIYKKLEGIPGIPNFIGRIDGYALAIEFIEGRNASFFRKGDLPDKFFIRLKNIIDLVHERGVVLCDMRNNKNVMVSDQDLNPYLIDFVSAFSKGLKINIIKNYIYNIFIQDDLLGIAKLKRRISPHLLTKEEKEKLENGLPMQKEAIFIRNKIRFFLKKLV